MSYIKAQSLENALALLKDTVEERMLVAGGTDLFLKGLSENLVDISALPELCNIESDGELLKIGAAVTHSKAAESELIIKNATALAEACLQVGSPQIRNLGTLGGNVVNAAPAADAAVALVALQSEAELIDPDKQIRRLPVDQLYGEYNCSVIDCRKEIVLRFILKPCMQGEGSAFVRLAARKALALPMANAAARIKVEDGLITELSLIAAPIRPAPTRLLKTEAAVIGEPVSEDILMKVEKMASEEATVRGSLLRC